VSANDFDLLLTPRVALNLDAQRPGLAAIGNGDTTGNFVHSLLKQIAQAIGA
jgi:hypothetical protein